jgi:hypothetical protein
MLGNIICRNFLVGLPTRQTHPPQGNAWAAGRRPIASWLVFRGCSQRGLSPLGGQGSGGRDRWTAFYPFKPPTRECEGEEIHWIDTNKLLNPPSTKHWRYCNWKKNCIEQLNSSRNKSWIWAGYKNKFCIYFENLQIYFIYFKIISLNRFFL